MELGPLHLTLLALVAFFASAINSIAGGGSLITFPTLVALGVPPLHANATNSVALLSGIGGAAWSERSELAGQSGRVWWAVIPALTGGFFGAWLLITTGAAIFEKAVPWLVAAATALVYFGPRIKGRVHSYIAARTQAGSKSKSCYGLAVSSAAGSIYSGYFGAGQGLVFLALLAFPLADSINRINALRQVITLSAKAAATGFFIFSGHIVWPAAIVMAAGSLTGGIAGGRFAAGVRPDILRASVTALGTAIAAVFFAKQEGLF